MYRIKNKKLEVFLAHPGGPFFKNKDEGHWTIPKGEVEEGEDLLQTAVREFKEETGITPEGHFISLGHITQKGGKIVHAWAFEGDRDPHQLHSSNFLEMEWPPRSGKKIRFPEMDRAEFFTVEVAKQKLKETQAPLIDRLSEYLGLIWICSRTL